MKRVRRAFTREFKLETVRLLTEGGKSVEEVADELAIDAGVLRRWLREFTARGRDGREPGPAAAPTLEEEVRQLRRENALLRQERDILKKAAAYFASDAR
jgi:transposase